MKTELAYPGCSTTYSDKAKILVVLDLLDRPLGGMVRIRCCDWLNIHFLVTGRDTARISWNRS
jgi:hypothetical protein